MATAEFPSNSKSTPKTAEAPKKRELEQVTTGKVEVRAKPLGKKVGEWLIGIGSYVLNDILIPAARDTAQDAGEAAVRRAFNPNEEQHHRKGRNQSPYGGSPYFNYGKAGQRATVDNARSLSRSARAQHKFEEIIFDQRVEAEHVLDQLIEQIAEYDAVAIRDLYTLAGISSDYTDEKYGWTDLRSASVHRVKGGYLINLPRPEVLD